jgi:hypothetical protein
MIFGESFQEPARQDVKISNLSIPTDGVQRPVPTNSIIGDVSGMWSAFETGSAQAQFSLVKNHPFIGNQNQWLAFNRGVGEVGIENEGLNREGMFFAGGRPYEGCLWARSDGPTTVCVSLESDHGSKVLAEQNLSVTTNGWQRLNFKLTPAATNHHGRFSIKLKQPGSVAIGYAFLQPGAWGRFHDLPVRKDVADGLLAQGLTVLRYGGSMVNARGYRWKNMIGSRDRRPPYTGT